MIESERKLRDFRNKILSNDETVITRAIVSARDEDPFKGAIGLLTELFNGSDNLIIRNLVTNFMNDLKSPEARNEVIAEVIKDHKQDTICMLVSSCWQSGLDYSGFVVNFTNVLIQGDYLTALECFTVIEESAMNMSPIDRKEVLRLLEFNIGKFAIEKNSLLDALITILK